MIIPTSPPPDLFDGMSQDERYFALFAAAIHKCLAYRPKFGKGRGTGLEMWEFKALYEADPFYHWVGLDSALLYAAHKAAGGMTSMYRQIGIGSQWIFRQMLQDCLGLSQEQTLWGYTAERAEGNQLKFALDGRIEISDLSDMAAKARVQAWLREVASIIGLPDDTLPSIRGVVFEVRQGYKSKDSKRQNADIANASKAYAHRYIPTLLLFSTQIDDDVARRYAENMWLILKGSMEGTAATSTYAFCREIVGYDLASFFARYSPRIKAEVENVLKTLLTA